MITICKFILACNATLSSRTYRFRVKREKPNLTYTENRDMVKYGFIYYTSIEYAVRPPECLKVESGQGHLSEPGTCAAKLF